MKVDLYLDQRYLRRVVVPPWDPPPPLIAFDGRTFALAAPHARLAGRRERGDEWVPEYHAIPPLR